MKKKQPSKRQVEQRARERENQLQFVTEHLEEFLAGAWEGYQAGGRGALVILESHITVFPGAASMIEMAGGLLPGTTEAAYITDHEMQKSGGWPNEDTAKLVSMYDPHTQFVVLFECSDGGWATYRMAGHLTPPQAHKKLGSLIKR